MTAARSRIVNRKHGMEGTPEYRTWVDMKRRCQQPHRLDYKNYGGRGITVCERWESFENFYADMGPRPEGHTLDRLQNHGPYTKLNCIWAPRKKQERNKRTNRMIEYSGRRMTLAEAVELSGVNYFTAHSRLQRGLSITDALDPKSRRVLRLR